MTNLLLGIAIGVAVTFAVLKFDVLKAKFDALRAKK